MVYEEIFDCKDCWEQCCKTRVAIFTLSDGVHVTSSKRRKLQKLYPSNIRYDDWELLSSIEIVMKHNYAPVELSAY